MRDAATQIEIANHSTGPAQKAAQAGEFKRFTGNLGERSCRLRFESQSLLWPNCTNSRCVEYPSILAKLPDCLRKLFGHSSLGQLLIVGPINKFRKQPKRDRVTKVSNPHNY